MRSTSAEVAGGTAFESLLAPFELETLDGMSESVCALLPDFRIGYVNPAWTAFGFANGASAEHMVTHVGASFLEAIPPVLRDFHEALLTRARSSNEPTEHDYECSSPSVRRAYRMRIHPCTSGAFVIIHSLLREASVDEPTTDEDLEAAYRDERGLYVQCSNCRRMRRASATSERMIWDWVPAFVAELPRPTSHSICAACADYHYGGLGSP
jgi:hypothetical protein